jgi:hypothetical protein
MPDPIPDPSPRLQMLTLTCPSCGARCSFPPGADHFTCEYCGNQHIFNLPSRIDKSVTPRKEADLPRPWTPRPESVRFEKRSDSITLVRRWFSFKIIPLVFFCVVWDGFLCFWYGTALFSGGGNIIMLLFPMLHLAVGVGLTYYVIATFLNHTTIRVDRQMFSVLHDPVPWTGEIKVPVADLTQLYCTQKVSSGKNSTTITYDLNAVLKDGTKKTLLTGLDAPEVASFIEQQIELWLDITDKRVAGEVSLGML